MKKAVKTKMLNNYWQKIFEEVDKSNMDRIHLREAILLIEEAGELLTEVCIYSNDYTMQGIIHKYLKKVSED